MSDKQNKPSFADLLHYTSRCLCIVMSLKMRSASIQARKNASMSIFGSSPSKAQLTKACCIAGNADFAHVGT